MPKTLFMDPHFKLRRFIIGLLILLAAWPVGRLISGFFSQSGSCRDNFTYADIKSLQNALDMYRSTTGSFPTQEQGLNALIDKPTLAPVPSHWVQIMKRESLDAWKNPYAYCFPGSKDPTIPEIYCMGPDGLIGTDDDIHLDD